MVGLLKIVMSNICLILPQHSRKPPNKNTTLYPTLVQQEKQKKQTIACWLRSHDQIKRCGHLIPRIPHPRDTSPPGYLTPSAVPSACHAPNHALSGSPARSRQPRRRAVNGNMELRHFLRFLPVDPSICSCLTHGELN